MAEIKAIIKGENQISPAIKSAEKDLTGFQNSVKKTGDALNKAFVATAVVAGIMKIASAAKECINEFSEAEKVSLRLEKVWNNVGNTTGKSYASIAKYADAIEKTTYFSAEAAKESALLLAATESLTQKGFERALDASADLAAALGEDMATAAATLAKAMEDPAAALTRLKTIGVTFTEEEKNQIKALTEANKTYEAQDIILSKIESKYKDVAKAINNTPTGTLDNIKDVLSDIRKSIGQSLLNSISPALVSLYEDLKKIFDLVNPYVDKGNFTVSKNLISYFGSFGSYRAREMFDGADFSTPGTTKYNVNQTLLEDIYKAVKNEGLTYENIEELLAQYKTQLETMEGSWSFSEFVIGNQDSYSRTLANYLGLVAFLEDAKLSGKYVKAAPASAPTNNSSSIETSANNVETVVEKTTSAIENFFKSYGSSSSSYLAETYQTVIDEAQGMLDKMTLAVPTSKAEMRELLGLDENATGADIKNAIEEGNYIQVLTEIISSYSEKLNALNVIPEILDSPTLTDLDSILDTYGKNSVSYQKEKLKEEYNRIAAVFEYASEEEKVYLREILAENEAQRAALEEIPEVLEESFLDSFTEILSQGLGKIFKNSSDSQLGSAAGVLLNTAISNIGDAGDVIQRLATNMASMGPVLGAIVTALQYVIEGFAEVLRDTLNTFVRYGIEPLREFGRILADAILPLFEAIMPSVADTAEILVEIFTLLGKVLKPIITAIGNVLGPILSTITQIIERLMPVIQAVANVFIGLAAVIEWFGQWIGHIIAWVVNNALGWAGVHINDPGRPDDLATFIDDRMANVGEFNSAFSGEAATQTAVQNASYSGGTTVHLNVYNYGNIVGENGINEFALTIRDKLYEMNYYGR